MLLTKMNGNTKPEAIAIAEYLTSNLNNQTFSPSTVRRKLAAFRKYAEWLGIEHFLVDYNPPKQVPSMPHPISGGVPSVIKMLNAAKMNHHKAAISLCGLCGLRIQETLTVTADDITIGDTFISLRVTGKGYKIRDVPVSPLAWAYLAYSWHQATLMDMDRRIVPMEERNARRMIKRVGAACGLVLASHDLRSTFATAAYENCRDPLVVQQLLGHSSVVTTQGYIGTDAAKMREATEFTP